MSSLGYSLDILVAHRGLQSEYPENTALALCKAIECGAINIELDVQFSQDHLPVIYHDKDLARVSSIEGMLKDYSREQLLTFSASESHRFGNFFTSEKIAP